MLSEIYHEAIVKHWQWCSKRWDEDTAQALSAWLLDQDELPPENWIQIKAHNIFRDLQRPNRIKIDGKVLRVRRELPYGLMQEEIG